MSPVDDFGYDQHRRLSANPSASSLGSAPLPLRGDGYVTTGTDATQSSSSTESSGSTSLEDGSEKLVVERQLSLCTKCAAHQCDQVRPASLALPRDYDLSSLEKAGQRNSFAQPNGSAIAGMHQCPCCAKHQQGSSAGARVLRNHPLRSSVSGPGISSASSSSSPGRGQRGGSRRIFSRSSDQLDGTGGGGGRTHAALFSSASTGRPERWELEMTDRHHPQAPPPSWSGASDLAGLPAMSSVGGRLPGYRPSSPGQWTADGGVDGGRPYPGETMLTMAGMQGAQRNSLTMPTSLGNPALRDIDDVHQRPFGKRSSFPLIRKNLLRVLYSLYV